MPKGKKGFQKGNLNSNWLGRKHSRETKNKISSAHIGMRHTQQTKDKIKNSMPNREGKNNPMFGKGATKGSFKKGEKPWNWMGEGVAKARRVKINRNFGFIPLNEWFEGCEAHHIDKEFVIHIPKEMHRSVWHSVTKNINMDKINDLAIDYCYGD